jgi:hypothetical protein
MNKVTKAISIALLATQLSTTAQAAQQWCVGTLSNLWVDKNGVVFVRPSWRGDYIGLCNVNDVRDGVSPTLCMAWLSAIRSSIVRQAPTTVHYSDAPSCATVPTYESSPAPYYVLVD